MPSGSRLGNCSTPGCALSLVVWKRSGAVWRAGRRRPAPPRQVPRAARHDGDQPGRQRQPTRPAGPGDGADQVRHDPRRRRLRLHLLQVVPQLERTADTVRPGPSPAPSSRCDPAPAATLRLTSETARGRVLDDRRDHATWPCRRRTAAARTPSRRARPPARRCPSADRPAAPRPAPATCRPPSRRSAWSRVSDGVASAGRRRSRRPGRLELREAEVEHLQPAVAAPA